MIKTKKLFLIEESKKVDFVEFYRFRDNRNTTIHTDTIISLDDDIWFDDLPNEVRCEWEVMDAETYNSTIYANCGEMQEDEKTLVIVLDEEFNPLSRGID